jgi:hypothetical protein
MEFWILFLCWWASPAIILQKPSNVPPCTSTCFGAPFWKPSNPLIHREPLVQLSPNGMRDSTLLHQGYAPWSREFSRWIPCGCLLTLCWRIAPNLGVPTCNKYLCQNPICGKLGRRSRHLLQAFTQGERASSPPPSSWWQTHTRNTAEHMEVERMIVSSGEVGRAAPPYVLEVWWTS